MEITKGTIEKLKVLSVKVSPGTYFAYVRVRFDMAISGSPYGLYGLIMARADGHIISMEIASDEGVSMSGPAKGKARQILKQVFRYMMKEYH